MAFATVVAVLLALLASELNTEAFTQPPTRRSSPEVLAAAAQDATPGKAADGGPVETRIAMPEELSTTGIIKTNKFESEQHEAETIDGYTLTMFRIPNEGRAAVFLQHGLVSSSSDWVITGRGHALAFLLHDAGYDVWLGNFRGNRHSRKHRNLTTADKAFWDFSWNEHGLFDVPAMIDYVLEKTNRSSLMYIGHSEGTTAFLVMASMMPEYNSKVSAFVALAPTAFLSHPGTIVRLLMLTFPVTRFIYERMGWHEFLQPDSPVIRWFSVNACNRTGPIPRLICSKVVFPLWGLNEEQVDRETAMAILQTIPAGSPLKSFVHYTQVAKSGEFQQYDYGRKLNENMYGRRKPPAYPLRNISLPVHLFYSDKDDYASPQDVMTLRSRLSVVKTDKRITHETFNHLDFTYGGDAKKLVYDDVLRVVQETEKPDGEGHLFTGENKHTYLQ